MDLVTLADVREVIRHVPKERRENLNGGTLRMNSPRPPPVPIPQASQWRCEWC
jgi:hypothetical protein